MIDARNVKPSSFMSLEKDYELIVTKMLKDNNLLKLLYYTTEDAMERPNITKEEVQSIVDNNILIVPRIPIDKTVFNYVIINFDNFYPNDTNPYYRDNSISFDILCHYSVWNLGDFRLRPYKIAGEIDGMFNNQHLTGIGLLEFSGANQLLINDQIGGLTLTYRAVHGNDDKLKELPNGRS